MPPVPEYRGMPIYTPSMSPGFSSSLQLLRAPLKMKCFSVKKLQCQILEQLEDILSLAADVSIPVLKEEDSTEPVERQHLLSPASERKMSQIRDPPAERIMRQKIDNGMRMQNTIKYSEKIRQEWEERVEQTLSAYDGEEGDSDDSGESEGEEGQEGQDDQRHDHSSTTSDLTVWYTPIAALAFRCAVVADNPDVLAHCNVAGSGRCSSAIDELEGELRSGI
ncbi:uncharacterized protein TRAVEDRAFT_50798 [Trametes versicolor FP-101664 SS1]|uniref:uncharacterized protein n=1 Tax=Trametes versicolor (strain FP-101664) TaxID=717944 RepID=UPI0004622278|nr:uncharacterized protein TRAVEDRAFT_50798 [Trametes versicolor FP-101664 SS1]EIW54659.1 hypothetical protein TRAVEDRAFT_50798 [Trametes versicolor FP-101664 SS1]